MKYFSSDLHLGHKSILKFRDIPSTTLEEYNAWVIKRIYDLPAGSDLYLLGDTAWDKGSFIQLLNGKPRGIQLHIIEGNHDRKIKFSNFHGFNHLHQAKTVKDMGHKFFLSHYQCVVWDCSHYNSINLFGHTHKDTPTPEVKGRQLNVNCEFWDYRAVSSERIIELLDGVDNWDYLEVKRRRENESI
jgi:calcineurin-like phosphoesterase family protein